MLRSQSCLYDWTMCGGVCAVDISCERQRKIRDLIHKEHQIVLQVLL